MDISIDKKISYYQLFKELRNPETKRGIIFMIEFIKNMAKSDNGSLKMGLNGIT
jgi:uncharacterized protein YjgD (DUF1641 family)